MIVPAMNETEIYKEIVEDGIAVLKTVTTKLHIQSFVMKRTNTWRWVETLHIKSARNNQWSAFLDIGGGKSQTNLYVTTEDKFGITAYNFMMLDDMPTLIKYNSHFFKRYRERMELTEIKSWQVVKHFFRYNINVTPAYSDQDENGNIMAALRLPQGIGLGRFSTTTPITEMKTFIANSLLNKNQREFAKEVDEDDSYRDGIKLVGNPGR